jgi:hypothetical protein
MKLTYKSVNKTQINNSKNQGIEHELEITH